MFDSSAAVRTEGWFIVQRLIYLVVLWCFSAPPAIAGALDAGRVFGAPLPRDGGGLVRPVAVFGDDNRAALAPSLDRLRLSVGLVYSNRARSVCSGFCVADTVVATAAHCLFRTAGERRPSLRAFRFVLQASADRRMSRIAGYDGPSPAPFVRAGSTELRVDPPIDATDDWALMRLDQPICRDGVLGVLPATPAQVAGYAARKRLIHVSFHRNFRDWELANSGPCEAGPATRAGGQPAASRDFRNVEDLVFHTCDTGGASSGSPLVAMLGHGAFAVVGMNVGTYVQTRMLLEKGQVVRRFKADPIANTAVAGRAFHFAIDPLAGARILSSAGLLRTLQRALAVRRDYTGPIDGAFGPELSRAIQRFERGVGLPPLGLATETLLKTLRSGTRQPPTPTSLSARRVISTAPIPTRVRRRLKRSSYRYGRRLDRNRQARSPR